MKIVEPIRKDKLLRGNRDKIFKRGYNEEFDIIVLSHNGKIGDIVEIQNLKIALPQPEKVYSRSKKKEEQYWERKEIPKELSRIKTVLNYYDLPEEFQSKHEPYIDEEIRRRRDGFWFKNNGEDTYITGSNYMYLQWSKIDVGYPDYRYSNRVFFYFWEACKIDYRCYGICYLKNRRSGFSFMSSSEIVNLATQTKDSQYGILSKSGDDAKSMFTSKVVPISAKYPFFFKPIQSGEERPKTELSYSVPSTRLTRKSIREREFEDEEELEGLDTKINHKSTANNSYDSEKLKLLIHDEFAKWERPNNILKNWDVTKTCLLLGLNTIVGKCMMGSTCNAKDKGGANGQELYLDSNILERDKNGQTTSGLYSLFIPMEYNVEGYIDKYGFPVIDDPEEPVMGIDGKLIHEGAITFWNNKVENLKKKSQDKLNEFYRQFPRIEDHAFRDEAKNSLFNLSRIYEQIDFNGDEKSNDLITKGSFSWENGIQDSRVIFTPNTNGRFKVSWIPPVEYQNKIIKKNGIKHPANEHMGAFGCDSYDISGTVDGRFSNGALHGLTKFSMDNHPANTFFLEYVARPQTADIFFEDVLMAIVFYGMPILVENNKPRLLYYLKKRGYRGYSMNRPDKLQSKLSSFEREVGGIPNNSEDIKQAHAAAIESYIDAYVGNVNGEVCESKISFNRTLKDWAGFDINKRTKFDASISSGLAIMACNKNKYHPSQEREVKQVPFSFGKYQNTGMHSKIL